MQEALSILIQGHERFYAIIVVLHIPIFVKEFTNHPNNAHMSLWWHPNGQVDEGLNFGHDCE